MLLVKTRIGVSSVHGIGLFAAQFIPQGTVTWEYHPEFDASYSEDEITQKFPPPRNQVFKYAYFHKELDRHVLCLDDMRFLNHCAHNPNLIATANRDIAARDIQKGEELLCNYNCFDDEHFSRPSIHESELS